MMCPEASSPLAKAWFIFWFQHYTAYRLESRVYRILTWNESPDLQIWVFSKTFNTSGFKHAMVWELLGSETSVSIDPNSDFDNKFQWRWQRFRILNCADCWTALPVSSSVTLRCLLAMPVKYGLGDAVDYEDSNGSIHRLFVYGILLDGKYLLSRSA